MKFKTQYNGRVRRYAVAGDPIACTYEPYYDDDGVLQLKVAGKVNTYLEIQSHADSVDINIILARYKNGETDVLNKVQGFFGDVTNLPKSYAEMLNLVMSGERFFDSLSTEIKEKFDHSFAQFLAQYGTPEFEKKVQPTKVDMKLVEEAISNQKESDNSES